MKHVAWLALSITLLVGRASPAVAQQAAAGAQCSINGLYLSEGAGWFTRFDNEGHWATYTSRPAGPTAAVSTSGRFVLRGATLAFDAESTRCAENSATYRVRFSPDCRSLTLELNVDSCRLVTRQDIRFVRVE